MNALGKLVLELPYIRRNSLNLCYNKKFLRGTEVQERLFPVHHHILSNSNNKVPLSVEKLYTLDQNRASLTKDMSSVVNEEFRHLDYNQLLESKSSPNNIIIDVREKNELDKTGVIPGAYHIPLGDIEKAFNTPEDEFKKAYNFEKPKMEDSLIFSCRSGKRSLIALEKALAIGFKNAKHYKGGWLDWEQHLSETKK